MDFEITLIDGKYQAIIKDPNLFDGYTCVGTFDTLSEAKHAVLDYKTGAK